MASFDPQQRAPQRHAVATPPGPLRSRLLRKPAISAPADAGEREADAVADQIMAEREPGTIRRTPAIIQRACAACEEDEDDAKRIQTKRASAAEPSIDGGLEAAVRVAGGAGEPLSAAARGFFEPRFGHDFSRVRIHADTEAAGAARAVQARAYTLGSHIVFDAGQYSADTTPGRHLLAHELTHVVQQRAAPLRLARVPHPAPSTASGGDFDVVGKSGASVGDTTTIFFDINSDSIDADEAKKLGAFVGTAITLNAHQSEEETAGTDTKRSAMVKQALIDKGQTDAMITVKVIGPEAGRLDYRNARIVEIVPSGGKAAKQHCVPGRSAAVACKNVGRSAPFRAAIPIAVAAIEAARTKLKKDVGAGTPDAATLAVVKKRFAKESNSDKVRDKLEDIRKFVKGLPPMTECHTECDPDCGNPAYWDPSRTIMVLCPGFMGKSAAAQAGLLMHEATHGVPSIQSDDLGYASDRVIDFLDEAHAFRNTDSYATLVRDLAGMPDFADNVPADTLTGFGTKTVGGVTVNEVDLVKKPLALAEKWCIWAFQDLQFVYGKVVEAVIANDKLTHTGAIAIMQSAHDRFGVTDPAAKPTLADQHKLAALEDKFERMGITAFNRPIKIAKGSGAQSRFDTSKAAFPGGPAQVQGDLEIGADVLGAATPEDGAKLVITRMVHALRDTSLTREDAYGLFAFDRSQSPDRL